MFRSNPNIQIASMIHENEAFVRGFLRIPRVEDVKTKLSCEVSFKIQDLKMWKRSFRARYPSNSRSWRCENEAFVRGFLQNPRFEDVKTKLSCEVSFEFQELKRWRLMKTKLSCEVSFEFQELKRPFRGWKLMKTKLSCEVSFEFQELKMWKRSFRARFPSNSKRSRSERISSMHQTQSVLTHAKHNSACQLDLRISEGTCQLHLRISEGTCQLHLRIS